MTIYVTKVSTPSIRWRIGNTIYRSDNTLFINYVLYPSTIIFEGTHLIIFKSLFYYFNRENDL